MVFEQFLNKSIKVVKKDGYVNYGILRSLGHDFIGIEFNDGRIVFISFSEIKELRRWEDKHG